MNISWILTKFSFHLIIEVLAYLAVRLLGTVSLLYLKQQNKVKSTASSKKRALILF